ncbi:Rha family phage regulatory protein [Tissierella praeacuta]|uniref:Rha family transcriptional regulator n=1 Tax=Tissierella praeacuta TaxID=43131 RepID=UPI001042DD85|nr:Rha family transcriptional regulator [Tissierella praeacuta]TCU75835.1 Rha family phage regulatory protein [Tissierella praeacuta]
MNNLINIQNKDGKLTVSSREVAENFEKRHNDVVEVIEGKIKNLTTENIVVEQYFIPSEFNHKGNIYKEYLLTRDGFSFIVMGFTGAKADQWKLKYIEAFNKMENTLKEVYHISQTAIVNNIMETLEDKLFTSIDQRLSVYEENYRPTHANKIDINNYIKNSLGDDREIGEVDLVKQRVLLMLDANAWQDVPYKKLTNNMRLIDESIRAVKSFRSKSQLSLFER